MNPNNYKILTFKDDSFSIDIRFDSVWKENFPTASDSKNYKAHLYSLLKGFRVNTKGVNDYYEQRLY